MGKKQLALIEIFSFCKSRKNMEFNNIEVKEICAKYGFKNPFDLTKIDSTNILPGILKEEDYFIVHLGEGKHKFLKGIGYFFHEFENIPEKFHYEWKYRKSILNEYDTSESNILSVVSNQRILHDFLYEDIVADPKVYFPHRTKIDMQYQIGDTNIIAKQAQMEIDLTLEYNGKVTVIEGKNKFPVNFAVYQIFNPYYYFEQIRKSGQLNISEISACYVLRKRTKEKSIIRLYLYGFSDPLRIDSLVLKRCAQYELIQR